MKQIIIPISVECASALLNMTMRSRTTKVRLKSRKGLARPPLTSEALIAWTYMEKGELDRASEVLKETKSRWWALGKLHLLNSEYDKAKTNYEKLLASAEKSGSVKGLFTAYTGLGKVYEGLEDYKKAEEYYEKGMKLTEEMRSSLLPSERKNFFEVKVNGFDRSDPAKMLDTCEDETQSGTREV